MAAEKRFSHTAPAGHLVALFGHKNRRHFYDKCFKRTGPELSF
jgi:hypothetical protein